MIDNSCPTGLRGGVREGTQKCEAIAEHLALRVAAQGVLDPFALSKVGGQLGGTCLTYSMALLEGMSDAGYATV